MKKATESRFARNMSISFITETSTLVINAPKTVRNKTKEIYVSSLVSL